MDDQAEVREFLISRRATLTPPQAALPDMGNGRAPGLRRGEVAALAGLSIEYYRNRATRCVWSRRSSSWPPVLAGAAGHLRRR